MRLPLLSRKKIAEFGAQMMFHEVFDDDDKKITDGCLRAIEAGAEIVFCTGGMSVDPDDKTPLAIKKYRREDRVVRFTGAAGSHVFAVVL